MLEMEKCHLIHCGIKVASTANGGRKYKRQRKGQYKQSFVLASSTHKLTPRPADLQIMVENYEGKDLNYNTAYQKSTRGESS